MMPPPAPRFDMARICEVTGHGSTRFWTSLEELLDEEGFRAWLGAEFPAASSMFDDPGRRQFLKLMGASLLLAGLGGALGGCSDGKSDQAIPYVNQPENTVPGIPRQYATAVLFEGYAQPVIATTYSGRPTKLDGNPDHPITRGASDAFMQSAIFGLYDPERSKTPTHDRAPASWAKFDGALSALRQRWQQRNGEGLRILSGATTSPTFIRQMRQLASRYPNMRWHRYEPIGTAQQDNAMAAAFGRVLTPHLRLESCEVVVSLDHDLLGPGPHQVLNAGAWANRRGEQALEQGRSRLHIAEAMPSLTGTVAITRLPCDPSRIAALVQAFGAAFEIGGWTAPELNQSEKRWLTRAVNDLRTHQGKGLFIAGATLDPRLQALGPAINDKLQNTGKTIWYSEPLHDAPAQNETLDALADDITAGGVDTLIVLDCNPVYASTGTRDFAKLLTQVPHRIHAGLHADETANACEWHLPLSHALEMWSDARAVDGHTTIIQPVVNPLYASRSIHQIADMLLGIVDPATDSAVRKTWQDDFGAAFDDRWTRALHDGFVEGTQAKPVSTAAKISAAFASEAVADAGQVEIVFCPDPTVWDGRFGNIAWLQELPKPLTKITWDNIVGVSPTLAAAQGLSNGDVVEVRIEQRHISGPVWIVPGQAANTVALFLGYGRMAGGEIAKESGYSAYTLLPANNTSLALGALARTNQQYPLATTQAHHRMEGFDFVREVTSDSPRTSAPKETPSLYKEWAKAEHAWGMVIDLDRCIGCNACVSACNVENNVQVVGKDQVSRGREMLWLRVDRYYTGSAENPRSFFQPVPCMHCEKAPCEMGCPVHATVHSPEGVNQQVYNRCIGTRTCSSYCPYKVRRFNWYDNRDFGESDQAAKNPDVSVRSRGVMEKCTYCTQRIQAVHVAADKENRPLRRDEVVTACQQACPAKAITFGDLKDEDSAVAQLRKSGRHYTLLEELGTRPRTTYLARWNDTPGDGEAG